VTSDVAGAAPALSVILLTPDSFDTIRAVVRCLARQTVHERIELLIVAPSDARIEYEESAVAAFASTRVVSLPTVVPTGPARAAAIRAARAPIVAFAEEHCFPAPGWAEALLDAHREEYAAVGPAIRNANPDTMVSWADLLMGYGPWLAPAGAREMDFLPGHNSSYKRAALLEYGDTLDELMEAETILQWDLRKRGRRLFLEPRAQAAHTNFGLWRSWIPVTFFNGRAFAATRADGWSVVRRLGFALASPAIPLVRLARSLRYARQSGRGAGFTLRVAPVLLCGLVADGAGQMVGYALGAGDSHQRMAAYEWHRLRHTPRGLRGDSPASEVALT
jgi:hypothetical protein